MILRLGVRMTPHGSDAVGRSAENVSVTADPRGQHSRLPPDYARWLTRAGKELLPAIVGRSTPDGG